jgi:glycosyltransferase AglD
LTAVSSKKELSILLPAHNEAWRIGGCIQAVENAVKPFWGSYEIIVSEDGSVDGTESVVSNIAKTNTNIVFLHSPVRLGKGKAIKNALHVAKGDVVVFMDVDLSTNLECLPKIVQLAKENKGLAIGSRHIEGARVKRPISRTLFSLGYNVFVRALFFDGVKDHQCGFKALNRNCVETIENEVLSDGWFFDTEMILRCKKTGFPLSEIGVEWTETRKKKESNVRLFRDASKMGRDLVKFKFRR